MAGIVRGRYTLESAKGDVKPGQVHFDFLDNLRFINEMPIVLRVLSAPARILIDAHGIPHIRATTVIDAFVVQGWNAARDRLWQIDLWRKRGLGLLAADFGPGYLEQDRANRLMLYRGAMAR